MRKRSPQSTTFPGKTCFQIALIIAATLWVYGPTLHGGWLWDDDFYITDNPQIRDWRGLFRFWAQPGSWVEYYPVHETLIWALWHLCGNNTFGYHLTTIGLHMVNALLVWRLLAKFGLRLAWVGGLIFAVHPAMVESVAWIAELKNTLSLLPFLLAMCAWIDYEKSGKQRDYEWSLGLFLAAMLCKITVSPFPLVILLYAWWKRGRIGHRDVLAVVPFLGISLVLSLTTLWCGWWYMQSQMVEPVTLPIPGFPGRVALVGQSLALYFTHCFWPVGLLPIYPRWTIDPSAPLQFLPWIAFGGMIYWLWRRRAGWGRHALLGLGFFVIFLAPFLGFISVTYMDFTWVMDHFLYIPIIGIIGIVVAGWEQLEARLSASPRRLSVGAACVGLALLAWESHRYGGKFVNQETLWTYTLQHNPDAYVAHNNLGKIMDGTGRVPEAMEHFKQALRIKPDYAEAHNNLGNALQLSGRITEAIAQYEEAIRLKAHYADPHYNLGVALAQLGQGEEAVAQYQLAVQIKPDNRAAYNNMGAVLVKMGRITEARQAFMAALQIDPAYALARSNLARLDGRPATGAP